MTLTLINQFKFNVRKKFIGSKGVQPIKVHRVKKSSTNQSHFLTSRDHMYYNNQWELPL